MSSRKRSILLLLTLLSAVLSTVFILSFFGVTSFGGIGLDASAVVLNGIVFLMLYRHIFRNPNLTEGEKHFWSIVVFIGLAAGQVLYLLRKVRISPTREVTT